MFVRVISRITGGLLLAATALSIVGVYVERSDALCGQDDCTAAWFAFALVALGILGTLVSIFLPRMDRTSGPRHHTHRRLIATGVAVQFVGTATLLVVGLIAIPIGLVFMLGALTNAALAIWILGRSSQSYAT